MVQEFKHEISDFWTASHSQIYPELQRMVDDDWIQIVTPASQPEANRNQTYYALTEAGHTVLLDWLREPLTAKDSDLFPLKLFFYQNKGQRASATTFNAATGHQSGPRRLPQRPQDNRFSNTIRH